MIDPKSYCSISKDVDTGGFKLIIALLHGLESLSTAKVFNYIAHRASDDCVLGIHNGSVEMQSSGSSASFATDRLVVFLFFASST